MKPKHVPIHRSFLCPTKGLVILSCICLPLKGSEGFSMDLRATSGINFFYSKDLIEAYLRDPMATLVIRCLKGVAQDSRYTLGIFRQPQGTEGFQNCMVGI
jgi:hypothetical protein